MSTTPLLKFTPSAMDPEFLEAITVQREWLIQALVDAALDTEAGRRHHLLVGPRGMGKSHVLTLVAERIRAATDDSLVLAVLNEDPWATRSYAKFLAAILGAIDHPQAAAIRGSGTHEEAERLLREAVGSKRLVLVVENLDEIFRRIGLDGQKRLRAFAENWPNLLVLGSTPQLFAGINRHASPFYAFFRITHLDELTPENAGELLRRIARLRGDKELASFLDTEVARRRILAINALAGGHPRIWLLFAGCISIPAIEELVPLFLQALDDLTPYYQSRLADLGDQQQELVLLLCEAGGALSNRQLADQSGLPQNQVGAALGKLEDRGYVRRALLPDALTTGDARASFWELREPLMRLALDVKQSRGEPLSVLVEFLREWYGAELLDEIARLPETSRLAAEYAAQAFRTLGPDFETQPLYDGSPEERISRANRGLGLAPNNLGLLIALVIALVDAGRLRDAVAAVNPLVAALPRGANRASFLLLANDIRRILGDPVVAEDAQEALAIIDELPQRDHRSHALRAKAFVQAGRDDDAIRSYLDASAASPSTPDYHRRRSDALARLGRFTEALDAISEAVSAAPDNADLHRSLASRLRKVGQLEDAERAVVRALELGGDAPWILAEQANIAVARNEEERALGLLRESLLGWLSVSYEDNPARGSVVPALLWRLRLQPELISHTLCTFETADDSAQLTRGLVELLPSLCVHPDAADVWLSHWDNASVLGTPLELGLQMVRAAVRYASSDDRAHLLALPPEQREIVVKLLERREDGV